MRQQPPEVRICTLTGRTSRSALCGYPQHKAEYAEFGIMPTWCPEPALSQCWRGVCGPEVGRIRGCPAQARPRQAAALVRRDVVQPAACRGPHHGGVRHDDPDLNARALSVLAGRPIWCAPQCHPCLNSSAHRHPGRGLSGRRSRGLCWPVAAGFPTFDAQRGLRAFEQIVSRRWWTANTQRQAGTHGHDGIAAYRSWPAQTVLRAGPHLRPTTLRDCRRCPARRSAGLSWVSDAGPAGSAGEEPGAQKKETLMGVSARVSRSVYEAGDDSGALVCCLENGRDGTPPDSPAIRLRRLQFSRWRPRSSPS